MNDVTSFPPMEGFTCQNDLWQRLAHLLVGLGDGRFDGARWRQRAALHRPLWRHMARWRETLMAPLEETLTDQQKTGDSSCIANTV